VAALVARGAGTIRVVPVFLVKEDLRHLVDAASRPGIQLSLDPAIGEQNPVIEAIASAIAASR
jgi:sirohydrochlorin ferrochelatase